MCQQWLIASVSNDSLLKQIDSFIDMLPYVLIVFQFDRHAGRRVGERLKGRD